MRHRLIASAALVVACLLGWAAQAVAQEPARGEADEVARQARQINRWLREHPVIAERIIRGLREDRAAPPAGVQAQTRREGMQMRAPVAQQRPGMMMRGQGRAAPGAMMPGRGQGMGGPGAMMARRGGGMGRRGAMMAGPGRGMGRPDMMRGGQGPGAQGPAVCPHCGRPMMGPGAQPQAPGQDARQMLERMRDRFRAGAADRGRDMDRPRGDRPVARERGDRPKPEAERPRGDRPVDRERGDRPSPEAARERGERRGPEAERGREGPMARERGDRPAGEARRGRPEAKLPEPPKRPEARGDQLAEMAKAIERLEQQMKRLAERLEAVQRESKGEKENPRREGDRPR